MKKLSALISAFLVLTSFKIYAVSLPQGTCDQMVQHQFYSLCYSKSHRQAKWVAHDLTQAVLSGNAQRQDDFRADPLIVDNPVQASDYKGSGFDRGHMMPAGDMKISVVAMSESFFMSNMSPQNPSLNRGLWANLESAFRSWVKKFGDAWVITAPILKDGLQQTANKISIPEAYYKMIYIPQAQKMAAFRVPNTDPKGSQFWDYAVKVSDIENQTGLNFYSEIPDDLELSLENTTAVPGDF